MLRPSSLPLSRVFCPIRADLRKRCTDVRFPVRTGQDCWSQRFGRLLLPGEAASVDLGQDVGLDQAFRLGVGAFDVLRQQFVVEGFADVTGRQRADGLVEYGEDAGVLRVLGRVRRGSPSPGRRAR